MSTTLASDPSTEFRLAIYRILLAAAFLLVVSVFLSIPSYYQTTTLWYKTGADKVMLLAAHYLGLLGLILLYLQIILAARGRLLEQLLGPAQLLRWHRINGVVLLVLAACHILLVLLPEGLANLPLGKKFWPEMVGGLLFVLIALLVGSSYFRETIRLSYQSWKFLHRPAGYLAMLLVTVHVLFVSESFEQTIPRIQLLALFSLTVVWTVRVKISAGHKAANSSK